MMRESVGKGRACFFCGSAVGRLTSNGTALSQVWRGAGSLECTAATGEPRARSGLAYAAGFAGLAYLFGFSVSSLVFDVLAMRGLAGVAFVMLWSLWGPVALGLAYAAGVSLDRSPEKVGRLPALTGLFVGLYGTYHVAAELASLVQAFGRY
jgi:hypothetical protein